MTDWDKPLQFILIPSGTERGSVLVVGGEFTHGDADRLRNFLSSAGKISEIQLDSGGGNAAEGPAVGRVIRKAKLSTRVASGFACISSCSMAFLGGIIRRVDPNAIYGIHTFYDSSMLRTLSTKANADAMRNYLHQNERSDAELAASIQMYGQEMGISRLFFSEVMFTQRSEVFVSDQVLGSLRARLRSQLTGDQAQTLIKQMSDEGILDRSTDDGEQEARSLFDWSRESTHSQEDVDTRLASIISNDFRCISASQLQSYNVTNVVSR